jgi:DNA polymerase III epsilon subunit-like protein
MTRRIVWVDCETTGLEAHHEPWEIALTYPDGGTDVFELTVDLRRADSMALQISRFYERAAQIHTPNESHDPAKVAHTIAVATAGAHLGGASTSFDAGVLDRFLRRHGYVPAWHHHVVDVEERAAGQFGWDTPRGLKDTAFHVGLHVDEERTHTALYDAELARDVYVRLMYRAATLAPPEQDVADDGGDEEAGRG